ncbi:hypothetical protein AB4156_00075 [Cupriavidus sp. 2MCAB6]
MIIVFGFPVQAETGKNGPAGKMQTADFTEETGSSGVAGSTSGGVVENYM